MACGTLAACLLWCTFAGAEIVQVEVRFDNPWFDPAPDAAHSGVATGTTFYAGHVGPYLVPGGGDAVVPSSPAWQLARSRIGEPLEGRRPDFRLGEAITPPDGADTRVPPASVFPSNGAFYAVSEQALIASDHGNIQVDWVMTDGATNSRVYLISAVPVKRPVRAFWTQSPYAAPTVNLQGQHVKIHYNSSIPPPPPGISSTNTTVETLWIDETGGMKLLRANKCRGLVVMEFFRTGDPANPIHEGIEIVETLPPEILVQEVEIGRRLFPAGAVYGSDGLIAEITKGSPDYAEKWGGGVKEGWVFPLRTTDEPWRIEVYWKHKGIMDVEWPYEVDRYRVRWPEYPQVMAWSERADSPGPGVYFPKTISVHLQFAEPESHVRLSDGHEALVPQGEGYALMKYVGTGDVWYEVIRTVSRTNAEVFNIAQLDWEIGDEIVPSALYCALALDGNDDAVSIPGCESLFSYTFEAWLRPAVISNMNLFVQRDAGAPGDGTVRQVALRADGRLVHRTLTASGVRVAVTNSVALVAGEWCHVAAMADGYGMVRLFVDGTEVGQSRLLTNGLWRSGDLLLGGASRDGGGSYGGAVRDVRIWNRALGEPELRARMAGRCNGSEQGLLVCYNFEHVADGRVPDVSGGNDGLVQGGAESFTFHDRDGMSAFARFPGYVYAPAGTGYNPSLYAYPSNVVDGDVASSWILAVNTGILEVWWANPSVHDDMPDPIYYPSLPIRYNSLWPDDVPTLVLAGQGNDSTGRLPTHFNHAAIYYQNDPDAPGYNPNEEHALIVDGKVYATRNDLNIDRSSEPYVLVQYSDGDDGNCPSMQAYGIVATNAQYGFHRDVEAGTLLQPPMPLSLFGECDNTFATGMGIWRDRKGNRWACAADPNGTGTVDVVVHYYYPVQHGFAFPSFAYGSEPAAGTEVPWLNGSADGNDFPVPLTYTIHWPDDTPVLYVGETLTKARRGLPAVRGQKSVDIIHQQSEYGWTTVHTNTYDTWVGSAPVKRSETRYKQQYLHRYENDRYGTVESWEPYPPRWTTWHTAHTVTGNVLKTAREVYRVRHHARRSVALIDPTQTQSRPLAALPTDLDTSRLDRRFDKTYFTSLPPHLRERLYYDHTAHALCLKGEFVEPAAGEPYLLLNVLDGSASDAGSDRRAAHALSEDPGWRSAVNHLATGVVDLSRDKSVYVATNIFRAWTTNEWLPDGGLHEWYEEPSPRYRCWGERKSFKRPGPKTYAQVRYHSLPPQGDRYAEPFDSLALSAGVGGGTGYVTLAFNNATNLCAEGDPVSLAVIRVEPPLYPGEVKAVCPENPLDEQLTMMHSADLGGNAADYEFDWRYRPPDTSGGPPAEAPGGWLVHEQGQGLRHTVIAGPGIKTLTDNYYVCRYRPTAPGHPVGTNTWSEWTAPMLAEGWIKRALNGINPFEQRVRDLRNNEVNTTVSLIAQAGTRWRGDVPLNLDNIEDFGLIEIYETVLRRGQMLSIDAGIDYGPANDALLLAAGRIHDLYMLLGNEAYADAADPTVSFGTADGRIYGSEAGSLFCFMNQFATLMDEELALLRGRDSHTQPSVRMYPVYNRLIWNFTKGINGGEAAYAMNYNILDEDGDYDGTISEEDAARLYPQGHGDAWGHYLTAIKGYYRLLSHTNFTWTPRAEAMLVGGVPVSVDYYDERKFAEAAAARARTGVEVVERTHRSLYDANPNGMWDGFRDGDTGRAWGLAEWAGRAGQGAYLDWITGNSLLPYEDTNTAHEGIQKIDRTTVTELKELPSAFQKVQMELDNADNGLNPLGLAADAIPFDINPAEIDEGKTHFEQIYERALRSLQNAYTVLEHAQGYTQAMRRQSDSLHERQTAIWDAEVDFENRLIEIFGYPYSDDIGPGKTYADGYEGPDLYHYQYVDIHELTGQAPVLTPITVDVYDYAYSDDSLTGTNGASRSVTFHFTDIGFLAKPEEWTGSRRAVGELQLAYADMLCAYYGLGEALARYEALLGDIQAQYARLSERSDTIDELKNQIREAKEFKTKMGWWILAAEVTKRGADEGANYLKASLDDIAELLPKCVGMSTDVAAPARGGIKAHGTAIKRVLKSVGILADVGGRIAQWRADKAQGQVDLNLQMDEFDEQMRPIQMALEQKLRQMSVHAADLQLQVEALAKAQDRSLNILARGARLLNERTRFRAKSATIIQANRYGDVAFRVFRNDALGKYDSAFKTAARYVCLAAKAYDYETGLLGDDTTHTPGSDFIESIVRTRTVGRIENGEPMPGGAYGDGGLADAMACMKADWDVLKGRLGFNNPQTETSRFSLRAEFFRIAPSAENDGAWREALYRYVVHDVRNLQEFRRYCLTGAQANQPEPAIVIPFSSCITPRRNFFGWNLAGGDNAYDPSHFATKIRSVGVWFSNYNDAFGDGLANEPRVYLIPTGRDVMRSPTRDSGELRVWQPVDQALPTPNGIGLDQLNDPDWTSFIDATSSGFWRIRRFPAMRAYHDAGFKLSEMDYSSRLIGRSVWNTRWLLIIPAGTLHSDTEHAIEWFINGVNDDGNGVKDIKLMFQTYSYAGN